MCIYTYTSDQYLQDIFPKTYLNLNIHSSKMFGVYKWLVLNPHLVGNPFVKGIHLKHRCPGPSFRLACDADFSGFDVAWLYLAKQAESPSLKLTANAHENPHLS